MGGHSVHKRLGWCSAKLAYLGAIALFAMMLLTTADVVGRYFFNSPIIGAYELTGFLVLILIFSSMGYTQSNDRHVSVDLFFSLLPRKVRLILDILVHLTSLALLALIAWMNVLRGFELKAVGRASNNLGIPEYPFAFFVVLGCTVLCIEYIRNLWTIKAGRKDDES